MIAFDTDITTQILSGSTVYTQRAALVPAADQAVPIVVAEEILRGRLAAIRKAESGKANITLEAAYYHFQEALKDLQTFRVLPYTAAANPQYNEWRRLKLHLGSHDLRIAAIAVAHAAIVVTRNRRDLERIPGLKVEFWS